MSAFLVYMLKALQLKKVTLTEHTNIKFTLNRNEFIHVSFTLLLIFYNTSLDEQKI